jgi:hypothetical protein
MPDRENVIRDLRYIKSFGRVSNNPQLTEIAESALALLKEQEAEIDEISDEYLDLGKEMAKQPEIVRCKDCKYAFQHWNDLYRCDNHCNHLNGYGEHHGHWFCADGEHKEGL